MLSFIKFVAICLIIVLSLDYYSTMFVTIYIQGFLIFCIIACLFLLAYAMLKNLKEND